MKPSELFGVVIRTIGFAFMVNSIWHFLVALATAPSIQTSASGTESYWPIPLILLQLFALAFGAFCFFNSDYIVNLSYTQTVAKITSSHRESELREPALTHK